MSQPQENSTGLFKHISLKAPAKPKLSNLPVFQLKPSLTSAKQSFLLPKIGFNKAVEKTSEPFIAVADARSDASPEPQNAHDAEPSRKRSLEPPFELPASKRAKVLEDAIFELDQAEPSAVESVDTNMEQENQSSDVEIAQYQDYFVEKNNEYEKTLDTINNELEDMSEGLKELAVRLLTANNELLTYNNPIFFGLNPHLEKEE